jgi:hypothetical protein
MAFATFWCDQGSQPARRGGAPSAKSLAAKLSIRPRLAAFAQVDERDIGLASCAMVLALAVLRWSRAQWLLPGRAAVVADVLRRLFVTRSGHH